MPEGAPNPDPRIQLQLEEPSAIAGAGLTSVYFELHEGSVKSAKVVAFLKHLRSRICEPITIIWDGLRANFCPKDLHELSSAALKALFKAKRTKSYIRAFWIQAELPL